MGKKSKHSTNLHLGYKFKDKQVTEVDLMKQERLCGVFYCVLKSYH